MMQRKTVENVENGKKEKLPVSHKELVLKNQLWFARSISLAHPVHIAQVTKKKYIFHTFICYSRWFRLTTVKV